MTTKTFTTRTKLAAATATSLVALTGAALAQASTDSDSGATTASLEARVVQLGHVPGFWATDCPMVATTAETWRPGDDSEAKALRNEGFVLGVRELLRSESGDTGVSVALRFRTAAGALADLDRREHDAGRIGYATNFAVPGSLPIRAYTVRAPGFTTIRVAYTRGVDEYAVAVEAGGRTDVGSLQRAVAATVVRVAGR